MDNRQTLSMFAQGANAHRSSRVSSTMTSMNDDQDLEINGFNNFGQEDLHRQYRSSRVSCLLIRKQLGIRSKRFFLAEFSPFSTR